jgi:uncharacterized integral membrane protein
MRIVRWLFAVLLLLGTAIVSVAFVLGNPDAVRVKLPFAEAFYCPLWLVIAASFFLGALAASAGLLFQLARKSLAVRRSQKRVRGLEAELRGLRTAAPAPPDGPPPAGPAA